MEGFVVFNLLTSGRLRTVLSSVTAALAIFFALSSGVTLARAQGLTPQPPLGWRASTNGQSYFWTSPPDARGSFVSLMISKIPSQGAPLPIRPWFEAMLGARSHTAIQDNGGMLSSTFQLDAARGVQAVAFAYQTRLGNQIITMTLGPGIDLRDSRAQTGVRTAVLFFATKTLLTIGGLIHAGPNEIASSSNEGAANGGSGTGNCRQVLVQNNSPSMRQVCSPTGDGSMNCHLEATTSQQSVWQTQCR